MDSRSIFNIYYGLNLHFTSYKYSIIKYGHNTKSANAKFDTMSPEQRHRFLWLSEKYKTTQDIVYAFISCHFSEISAQYDSKDAIITSYLKFKSRRDAITYNLKSDISKYECEPDKTINAILFQYLSGKFSPELMLLLYSDSGELLKLYEDPNFSWCRPKLLKLIKYTNFFNIGKYKILLEP